MITSLAENVAAAILAASEAASSRQLYKQSCQYARLEAALLAG